MATHFTATPELGGAAYDAGILSALDLANATGIARTTAQKVYRGDPVSPRTVSAVMAKLNAEGVTKDRPPLFERAGVKS